jgi:uncharacterized membrane protein YfcA
VPEFDAVFYIVVCGSFFAALSNAAFSSGGAMIILAVTSSVLLVSAIVPIHSTLLIGSTSARVLYFRGFIDWRIVGPFLLGSVIAVAVGARLYVELPETIIATAISMVMLIAIWLPQVSWRPKLKHPWLIVGLVHSLLSTLFAYGALLQAVILHTGLGRRHIVGTMAGCLTGMGILKIAGYAVNGFDYSQYLDIIIASILLAYLGTWLGKKVVDRISDRVFRIVFRTLVTVTALRLFYVNVLS